MNRTSNQSSVISDPYRLRCQDTSSPLSSIARRAEEDHLSSLKRKRRFTLIELLVVIAIIAILAAMLLPALNKARQTSLRVGCMGKMKDLNMQDRQYADMYKDFGFPYNVKLLYNGEVLGGNIHDCLFKGNGSKQNRAITAMGLRMYVKPFCPAAQAGAPNDQPYGTTSNGIFGLNCCFHNEHYQTSTNKNFVIKPLSAIKNPSTVIHFGESNKSGGCSIRWLSYMQYRHLRKQTCTFYDGHIEMRSKETITTKNVYADASGNN